MYPAAFEYVAVGSFEEACERLREAGGDAKLLAGGCSLIPLMKLRLAEPRLLVDLGRIPGADTIIAADAHLQIGALAREADVEGSELLVRHWPILRDTSSVIADPLVRNMGTIGGNVAHADPANDHPATMLALDARFVARSGKGEREIRADDFFQDLFVTALADDEVLTAIRLPRPAPGSGSAYVKYERQVGDFAVAAVAVVLRVDGGRIEDARIGLTNAGPVPVRAPGTETALRGVAVDDTAAISAAAELASDGIEPWGDLRGSPEYKRHLVRGLTARALRRAIDRAVGGAAGREPALRGEGSR